MQRSYTKKMKNNIELVFHMFAIKVLLDQQEQ